MLSNLSSPALSWHVKVPWSKTWCLTCQWTSSSLLTHPIWLWIFFMIDTIDLNLKIFPMITTSPRSLRPICVSILGSLFLHFSSSKYCLICCACFGRLAIVNQDTCPRIVRFKIAAFLSSRISDPRRARIFTMYRSYKIWCCQCKSTAFPSMSKSSSCTTIRTSLSAWNAVSEKNSFFLFE